MKLLRYFIIIIFSLFGTFSAIASPKFNGSASFYSVGNLVSYNIQQIYNNDPYYTTGSIQIETYGTWTPYQGTGSIFGSSLYTGYLQGIYPGYAYTNLSDTVAFSDSPTNYAYLVVVLREWNGYRYIGTDYRNVLVSSYFPIYYAAPSITTNPSNTTISFGQNSTIRVTASGSGTLSY